MTALVELSIAIAVLQLWLFCYSHLQLLSEYSQMVHCKVFRNPSDDVPFWLKNSKVRSLASFKKVFASGSLCLLLLSQLDPVVGSYLALVTSEHLLTSDWYFVLCTLVL